MKFSCAISLLLTSFFVLSPFHFHSFSEDIAITPEMVEALRTELHNDSSLIDDLKNSTEKMLNDTLTFIQSINNWNSKLEELNREIENAPTEIKTNEDFAFKYQKIELPNTKNLTIDEINQNLIQSEIEYKQKQNDFENIYKEFENRSEYRKSLITRISDLKKQIAVIKETSVIPLQDPLSIQKVKQIFNNAQILSLEKELEYHNKELDSFELKTNLISSRIEKLRVELREKEKIYNFWNNEFINRKQEEVQKNIQNSLNLLKSLTKTGTFLTEELSQLAQENLKLAMKAREVNGIENKILTLSEKHKNITQEYKKQKEQLDILKQRSTTDTSTSGWAFSLRQEKSKLPNSNELNSFKKELNDELILVENEYNNLLSKRLKISAIESQLIETFNQSTSNISEFEKKNIKKSIDDLIKNQKNILSTLINDHENYISLLSQTIETLNLWIQHTNEFKNFIDENIIWIRSPFPRLNLLKPEAIKIQQKLIQFNIFTRQEFLYDIILIFSFVLLVVIILTAVGKFLDKQINITTNQIKIPFNFSISRLFRFLYLFCLRISLIPFWLFLLSIYLNTFQTKNYLLSLIPEGIQFLIFPMVFFGILTTIINTPPLAEIILKNIQTNLSELRFRSRVFFVFLTINLFILSISSQLIPDSALADFVFRVFFSLFLIFCAFPAIYLSYFFKKKIVDTTPDRKNKIINLIINFLIAISIICISLVFSNLVGYNYGSLEITKKLFFTLFFSLVFLIIYRLSGLILNYYQWKSVLKTSIISHSTLLHSSQLLSSETQNNLLESEPNEILFYHIQRFIRYFIFILGFIVTIYIWSDIFPALSYLDKVHLWRSSTVTEVINTSSPQTTQNNIGQTIIPSVVEEWVSLLDLITSIFTMIATFLIIKNFSFYLDYLLSKYTNIQQGERYAITTITKYIIFTIGFLFALGLINITWNKVQWLVAGLGIGFGFGLQEIVANFVSGLILLFERPLRIGDVVTVGDVSGKVKSLHMRSTTILNWDNKELIVPNKDLLTQRLINWTRNEPNIRLCIPVGVSYKSDINKVISILTEIGRSHPFVETEPPPRAYFLRLGTSALEFELRVFTHSSYYLDLQHELLCTIFNRFKEENIEISYPQLDVHIRDDKLSKQRDERETTTSIGNPEPEKNETR